LPFPRMVTVSVSVKTFAWLPSPGRFT
jgi:hypothetical protein